MHLMYYLDAEGKRVYTLKVCFARPPRRARADTRAPPRPVSAEGGFRWSGHLLGAPR